jgi:signal transduction histidine kinase
MVPSLKFQRICIMRPHTPTVGTEQDLARMVEDLERELSDAHRREAATAQVLKAISRSTLNLQEVLDSLIESAVQLTGAEQGLIIRQDGEVYRTAAMCGVSPEFMEVAKQNPVPPGRQSATGRAVLERRIVHIEDVLCDAEYTWVGRDAAGIRTILAVPMLRGDIVVGVIGCGRREVRPFTAKQIELIQTFADQAVIAIENRRLFEVEQVSKRELQESLEYQTATSDVLNVISRSPSQLQPVVDTIVQTAKRLCSAERATMWRWQEGKFDLLAHTIIDPALATYLRNNPIRSDRASLAGRAVFEGRTMHVPDLQADPELRRQDQVTIGKIRTLLTVPLLRKGAPIGVLSLSKSEVLPFSNKQIDLVTTFADQAVIAIENARLFEEVQARTSELAKTVEDLEIASQHKSQFVANMSHELRTPLAAILGYAELMQEGFYEPQGPKSLDALSRIRSNGKHLLGLINTVLDIAKIESGQFTLNMAEYAIESVVETVRSATESLAQNKRLTLKTEVAKSLPIGLGDEQRLTQVLLNLVGNAIKFTDSGEVRVTAKAVNGHFAVSVMDTGPGISEQEQRRIFEQFHQVDSSLTKAKGGTGLGLAIAKQIVEMHGGRIWVESTPGKGATFRMELPTRTEYRKSAT